jgi:hypothetical protein
MSMALFGEKRHVLSMQLIKQLQGIKWEHLIELIDTKCLTK